MITHVVILERVREGERTTRGGAYGFRSWEAASAFANAHMGNYWNAYELWQVIP